MRRLATGLAIALLGGCPRLLPAQPSGTYRGIVERYAAGERGQALSELSRWSEDALRNEHAQIRDPGRHGYWLR